MQLKFNSFHLKLFAVLFMIVDHIAYYTISPDIPIYTIMRIVGRLAAPIFWFCFVEGYKRTKNKTKYKLRLLVSASIMSIGNMALHYLLDTNRLSLLTPNMFLSFFMCALLVDTIQQCIKSKSRWQSLLLFMLSIIVILLIGQCCEYSYFIICFVLLYHFVKNDIMKNLLYILMITALSLLLKAPLQIFAIGSLFFFMIYDDKKPRHNWKYFFYIFYPAHVWAFVIFAKLLFS